MPEVASPVHMFVCCSHFAPCVLVVGFGPFFQPWFGMVGVYMQCYILRKEIRKEVRIRMSDKPIISIQS